MATDRYTVVVDTKGAQTSLAGLKSGLGALGAATAAAFAVDKVVDFGRAVVDAGKNFQVMENQLKLITNSQEELNSTMEKLRGISAATFSDLGSTVELYGKLKLSTDALGKSSEQVLTVTKNFQQALALSGADAGTASGAIRQFGQAMASGTVRGDEFNSIVEALGPALAIMARESGVTVGELRDMSQAGELTADVFFDMVEGATAINDAFANLNVTTEQLQSKLKLTFDEVLVQINEATGATDKFDTALIKINQGLASFFGTSQSLADLNAPDIFKKFEENALSAAEAIIALETLRSNTSGFFFPGLGFSNQEEVDAITAQIDKIKELVETRQAAKVAADEERAANELLMKPLTALSGELGKISAAYEKNIPKSEKIRSEYDQTQDTLEKLLAMRGDEIAQTPEYERALKTVQERLAQLKGEMDGTKKSTDEAAKAMKSLTDSTTAMIDNLSDVTNEMQFELEKLNMDPLQRQIADIERDIQTRVGEQIKKLEAAMTTENAEKITEQINRLKEAAAQAIQQQTDLANQSYQHQRSFAYGWNQAFQEYTNDATNAANAAKTIFQSTTNSINSAIDNFVETGKLSLGDLLKDIAKTAAKTILKTGVSNLMSGIFGNNQGQQQQQQQQSSGGISGFFNNLFGGFFANGGFLPGGKFGIVGENGPELITGPANVTPGVGGAGAVNLVINAVDARSFKQLVARDPEFIYSVAQQGARSFR